MLADEVDVEGPDQHADPDDKHGYRAEQDGELGGGRQPRRVFERAQVAVGQHEVGLSKNRDERKKQGDAQEFEHGGEQHYAKDGESLPLLPG